MSAFGSKADISAYPCDVRFTPKKRTSELSAKCLLWVRSGHSRAFSQCLLYLASDTSVRSYGSHKGTEMIC